jgi:hypothetical protein
MLFDLLVVGHIIDVNLAHAVRGRRPRSGSQGAAVPDRGREIRGPRNRYDRPWPFTRARRSCNNRSVSDAGSLSDISNLSSGSFLVICYSPWWPCWALLRWHPTRHCFYSAFPQSHSMVALTASDLAERRTTPLISLDRTNIASSRMQGIICPQELPSAFADAILSVRDMNGHSD